MPSSKPFATAVAALTFLAAPVAAQTITGFVVDDGTGERLPAVALHLVDDGGRVVVEALANDSGAFRIQVPEPGSYVLRGSLIGYAPVASEPLDVRPGEDVVVEVRLAIEAVPMEPVVVRSRVGTIDPELAGFYSRMARGERSGIGHYISRADVDRMAPLETTDLLRSMPGVRIVRGRQGTGSGVRMTGGCVPAIYVDGTQVNRYPMSGTSLDDVVAAFSVEGIEVYRGPASQVGRFYDPGGCGLVLVWTQRGTASDEPWSWKKMFIGFGLLGAILLLMS